MIRPMVCIIDGLLYAELRARVPVGRGHKGHKMRLKEEVQSLHIIRQDAPVVSLCRRRAPLIQGLQRWSAVSDTREAGARVCRTCLREAKRGLRRAGVREVES